MNRCDSGLWAAIKLAAAALDAAGVRYVLIGSAALAAQGVDLPVPDADFLCGGEPPDGDAPAADTEESSGPSRAVMINGRKIDRIYLENGRLNSYLAQPGVIIDGVRVATPAAVLSIKKAVGRPKDFAHLREWKQLIARVP